MFFFELNSHCQHTKKTGSVAHLAAIETIVDTMSIVRTDPFRPLYSRKQRGNIRPNYAGFSFSQGGHGSRSAPQIERKNLRTCGTGPVLVLMDSVSECSRLHPPIAPLFSPASAKVKRTKPNKHKTFRVASAAVLHETGNFDSKDGA